MERNNHSVLQLLGLAKRAGTLTSGENNVLKAIRHRDVHYVLIAGDGGHATLKKITDKCRYYHVPCSTAFTRQELSQAIGQPRSIIGVQQPGFATQFKKLINNFNEGE